MMPRVAFDEASIDFSVLDPAEGDLTDQVEAHLDALADALSSLGPRNIAVSPLRYEFDCWPGVRFDMFLSGERLPTESGIADVNRDVCRRCFSLLDKCVEWDGEPADTDVAIDGVVFFAPSIAYAHACELSRRRVACLVFAGCPRRDEIDVSVAGRTAPVWFLSHANDMPRFLRTVFNREDVAERDFFLLASQAFPRLCFSESLSFGKFEGAYRDVRDRAAQCMSAVNDCFAALVHEHDGQPHPIAAGLRAVGCDASRESPNTRGSVKLMRQRDVMHEGRIVRCEWHAKLDPYRNRIHFALLDDGRVLIGIFAKHLDT